MVRRATLSAVALAGAVVSGAAMGYAAERRALRGQVPTGDDWDELRRPIAGRPRSVTADDGTRLHVEELGAAGKGGPTLVFAHAYALSQHAWHHQRRTLPGRFHCVFYDHRGHGRSQPAADDGYTVEALGRDLGAVVEATTDVDTPVVLVGHSMGGMAVLSCAEQRPVLVGERVVGAVLIDTAASDIVTGGVAATGIAAAAAVRAAAWDRTRRLLRRPAPPRPAPGELGEDVEVPPPHTSDLAALVTRAIGLSPAATPAQVAFTEQLLLECPSSVKAALGPALSSLDLRDVARQLRAPALVVVGGADRVTPPAAARRLAELLDEAELVELPGVGHMAPLEAHEQVDELIADFAADLAERSRQGRSDMPRRAGRRGRATRKD